MANAKSSLTRRTLHYYWQVTRRHKVLFAALMASTFAFVALLSYGNPYVMSLIVDQVSAQPVEADQVFTVFGPYIVALILINVFGQAASKLQDYTMYKLEIAASYDLATMSFDALCNQSMSFHSNRFGGTLVSQTTKFMSAYQQLIETIMFPFLPVLCSVIFTCGILLPRVPLYVAILMVLLAVYASISYYLYKRILSLNEKAASAQNQLSGELSDSVANILAVKTYGREDYERGLFDNANREVVARDSKRMWASLTRGIITACITVVIMSVVTVFIAGGNAKTQVFDKFELHIPAGQRVGLVGMSGAGKTTLTKLLLRLSDIQEGQILIDGQNIADTTQQSLRRQIAYVPQEALLFHRSIAENISYGKPEASMDQIRRAAKQANALEFIEKLPQGFDTITGERGIKLSGGQRQRIAIARALLADCPVLVLDEATSALDSESEKLVQDALATLMEGRTCIVVAHRLSTVASLDRIVVLDGGKIIEDGPHDELVSRGGEYAHLWNRQTGAYLE